MELQNTQNTQMDPDEDRVKLISERIISRALKLLRELETGFHETVYENALLLQELRKAGLSPNNSE